MSTRRSGRFDLGRRLLRLTGAFLAGIGCVAGGMDMSAAAVVGEIQAEDSLRMPEVGERRLRVLSPTLLELTLITTKESDAPPTQWNLVDANYVFTAPAAIDFSVTADGVPRAVKSVGFKRRPLYAPLRYRDLRIGNHLYLLLQTPLTEGQQVEVANVSGSLWSGEENFTASFDPQRLSPAIHVNQVGYHPNYAKKATVGYYLGSFGEMSIPAASGFQIVKTGTGEVAFSGTLTRRPDKGYTYSPAPYQEVYEADFTNFRTPGDYQLVVPGLGASFPFLIHEGTFATFARAFALGMYHQRCGTAIGLPHTRHDHAECHVAGADVPTMDFAATQQFLSLVSSDYASNPRHTAPQLKDVNSSLYPFVQTGKISVSGGHHDAGDYSKYIINSAQTVHYLVFAADAFGAAGSLDNLGIPESGDGKSDLLQKAKWEADFLAKAQDADGGFYFLVYPKERRYEDNVMPDKGDAQVVWPKTTAATAAAVAALAEIASSRTFKSQFPADAAAYMKKAELGWAFLENAIATHGKDGSYQKLTHYGNEFMHDDELAWAAAAMYVATGKRSFEQKLFEWYDPSDPNTLRWGWWRMFEGYGCAARTYAFASRTGRLRAKMLTSGYLAKMQAEIIAAADDHLSNSLENAYGTSFPNQSKVHRNAGWYFSSERAFDLTVAYHLSAKAIYIDTVIANLNYEAGANPLNMSYVTGLGWTRPREIVHQQAQNDHQVLPPSGIPVGNIQGGMPYLYHYKQELTQMSFPADHTATAPYPYYDRWADTFNATTEFVIVDQARSLASMAAWMARTSYRTQPWRSGTIEIAGLPDSTPIDEPVTASVSAPGLDFSQAQFVWEARDQDPMIAETFTFKAAQVGEQWVEVECVFPDGRRVFGRGSFTGTAPASVPPNSYQSEPVLTDADTGAIYHLEDLTDATQQSGSLTLSGGAFIDPSNVSWLSTRGGTALKFGDLGDAAVVDLNTSAIFSGETTSITLEAMIYLNGWKAYNRQAAKILTLVDSWNASLQLMEDPYAGVLVTGGQEWSLAASQFSQALPLQQWRHLSLTLDQSGYSLRIDGEIAASKSSSEFKNWGARSTMRLEFGNFDGWIDEVVVRTTSAAVTANAAPSVALASPSAGASFPAGSSVAIEALASDSDGTVAKVEFFVGADKIGEATAAPFTSSWTPVSAGIYNLIARAWDNGGTSTDSAAISVEVTAGSQTTVSGSGKYAGVDTATKGSWKGVHGADGYNVIGYDALTAPGFNVTVTGALDHVWAYSTTDERALQKTGGATDRIAGCSYSGSSLTVNVKVDPGTEKTIALYMLDWDLAGRSQVVELIDSSNGAVLDKRTVSSFQQGQYLVYRVTGDVQFRITKSSGPNAVLSGWFVSP